MDFSGEKENDLCSWKQWTTQSTYPRNPGLPFMWDNKCTHFKNKYKLDILGATSMILSHTES